MKGSKSRVICVWGNRHSLEINGDEVQGCPLRTRSGGIIELSDCKHCASHVKVVKGQKI